MNKLTVNKIIDFRNRTASGKKTFALNLNVEKVKTVEDNGGDYWISCTSAISNSYRQNENNLINEKIHELEGKFEQTENQRTKDMYMRNIDVLYHFETFDFNVWMPKTNFNIIKKNKYNKVLDIQGLQVQTRPHHVFTFLNDIDGIEEVGAVWFIARLGGYTQVEIAMFTDLLYRYLNVNFMGEYRISTEYCIVVDVVKLVDLNCSRIIENEIPLLLNNTIQEIKSLL